MLNLNKPGAQIIVVMLLFVVLVGVVIVALTYRPNTSEVDNLLSELDSRKFSQDTQDPNDSSEIIIDSSVSIKFNDQYIVTSNNWKITRGFVGKITQGIKCTDSNFNCPIYIVSKGESTFYISPKRIQVNTEAEGSTLEYKDDFSINTTNGIKQLSYLNTNVYTISSTTATQADAANVEIVSSMQEIFGCINNNLCLTTGVLPSGQEENKLYIDSFQDLLLSITTN